MNSSLTFRLIDRLAEFFLASFGSSFFVNLTRKSTIFYPKRIWRIFDRFEQRFDIFTPEFIFPVVFMGFVAISPYRISRLALFSIVLGILFFILGVKLSRNFRFDKIYLEEYSKKLTALLIVVSVIALLIDLYAIGTIPLLNAIARRKLNVTLTTLAMFLTPGGILFVSIIGRQYYEGKLKKSEARVYSLIVLFLTTFLITLLGYRTQTIVSLLGCTMAMFYFGLLGIGEILFSFLMVFLAVSGFGYYRAVSQGSGIGFFEVVGRRVALTLNVYDIIINKFAGTSGGAIFLATFSSFLRFIPGPRLGPRVIVARTLLPDIEGVSITSTLYGTVALGYGILGIAIFSLLLGHVLAIAHEAMKQSKSSLATGIFSLLMAYTLVGIETGLVDFIVFVLFITSYLILRKSINF